MCCQQDGPELTVIMYMALIITIILSSEGVGLYSVYYKHAYTGLRNELTNLAVMKLSCAMSTHELTFDTSAY